MRVFNARPGDRQWLRSSRLCFNARPGDRQGLRMFGKFVFVFKARPGDRQWLRSSSDVQVRIFNVEYAEWLKVFQR